MDKTSSTPQGNFSFIFLFLLGGVGVYNFTTVLYIFLETGTSDATPKMFGLQSIPPFFTSAVPLSHKPLTVTILKFLVRDA